MDLNSKEKINACTKALEFIPKTGKVGIGSGSTVELFAEIIPKGCKNEFFCVSEKVVQTLKKKGIKALNVISATDVCFDGADNIIVNASKRVAIKGAGALAFVDEKKIDYSAKKLILLVDEGKIKRSSKAVVFVEVKNETANFFLERIRMFGYEPRAVRKDNPHLKGKQNKFFYITIFGNENLKELEDHIDSVKGVKGSGIFSKKKFTLIIGDKKGAKVI